MRDEAASLWDLGPIPPLTYRGDGVSQITKGRGANRTPASFRPHGAHRRRWYETVPEAYRCNGDWHKVFALWVSISLLRTWRSGERMSPGGVGSPGRHGGILPVVSRMLASVTGSLIIAAKPERLLRQEKVTVPL